ncbi:unnamed protein product [Closterium sp. NIES-53]
MQASKRGRGCGFGGAGRGAKKDDDSNDQQGGTGWSPGAKSGRGGKSGAGGKMKGSCWYCEKEGHPWFLCYRKPDGWTPQNRHQDGGARRNQKKVANMVADSSDNNPKSNGGAEKKKECTAGQFFHIGEQGEQGDASAKVGAELHPLDYWVLDTGAAWTMTPHKELLDDVRAAWINEVCSASGYALKVAGAGRAAFKGADGKPVVLHDVLLVPDLKANLISLRKLAKAGVSTSTDGARTYKEPLGNRVLWDLHKSKDVYRSMWPLPALAWHGGGQAGERSASQGECNAVGGVGVKVSARSGKTDWATAHQRLGHVAMPLLKQLEKDGAVKGLKLNGQPPDDNCEICLLSKFTRFPFHSVSGRSKKPLELVHMDLVGPLPVQGHKGERYFLTIVDDWSRLMWAYPLKQKDHAASTIKEDWLPFVEKQAECVVKRIRTDRGERANRTILETARALLIESGVGNSMWPHAVRHATVARKRVLTKVGNESWVPLERWLGRKPPVDMLRVFGCMAVVHVPKKYGSKLGASAIWCVHLGLAAESKGWLLWEPSKGVLFDSRDVKFVEGMMYGGWKKQPETKVSEQMEQITMQLDLTPSVWEEGEEAAAEGDDGEKVQEAPAGGGDDVEISGSTKEAAGSEEGEQQQGKAKIGFTVPLFTSLRSQCHLIRIYSDDNAKGGRRRSGSRHPRRRGEKPRKEKQSTKSTLAMDADSPAGGKGRDDKEASCSLVGILEPTVLLAREAGEDFQAMAVAQSCFLKENGMKLQEDGDGMLLVSAVGDVLGRASYTGRVLCTDLRPCLTRSPTLLMDIVALRAIVSSTKSTPDRLHARFAHVGMDTIRSSAKHEVATGLDIMSALGADSPCVSCVGGKLARHTFPDQGFDVPDVLAVANINLCGPFRVAAKDGSLYFLLLKDRKTRYVWVRLVANKSDMLLEFQKWLVVAEQKRKKFMLMLRSDWGGEFLEKQFTDFVDGKGIIHVLTGPYTLCSPVGEPTSREQSAGTPTVVQEDVKGRDDSDDGGEAEESTDTDVVEVQGGPRGTGRLRRPPDFFVPVALTTVYDMDADDLTYDDAGDDDELSELDPDYTPTPSVGCKFPLHDILPSIGLLKLMIGEEPRPSDPALQENWDERASAGYYLMSQSLELNPRHHVMHLLPEVDCGPKAWTVLKELHAPTSVVATLMLERELSALRLSEGEPVQPVLDKMRDLYTKLATAEITYPEQTKCLKMLSLLPESWLQFTSGLSLPQNQSLWTLEWVRTKILEEDFRCRQLRGGDDGSSGYGMQGSKRGRGCGFGGAGRGAKKNDDSNDQQGGTGWGRRVKSGRGGKSSAGGKMKGSCWYCEKEGHPWFLYYKKPDGCTPQNRHQDGGVRRNQKNGANMVADSSDNNPKSNGGAEKKKERTAGQFFHIGQQGEQGDASAKVGAELHPLDYWVLDTGAAWTMTKRRGGNEKPNNSLLSRWLIPKVLAS